MRVNVCKEKQLSNMRSKGEGVTKHLDVPKTMGLEDALEYIDNSEKPSLPRRVRYCGSSGAGLLGY